MAENRAYKLNAQSNRGVSAVPTSITITTAKGI